MAYRKALPNAHQWSSMKNVRKNDGYRPVMTRH